MAKFLVIRHTTWEIKAESEEVAFEIIKGMAGVTTAAGTDDWEVEPLDDEDTV